MNARVVQGKTLPKRRTNKKTFSKITQYKKSKKEVQERNERNIENNERTFNKNVKKIYKNEQMGKMKK